MSSPGQRAPKAAGGDEMAPAFHSATAAAARRGRQREARAEAEKFELLIAIAHQPADEAAAIART